MVAESLAQYAFLGWFPIQSGFAMACSSVIFCEPTSAGVFTTAATGVAGKALCCDEEVLAVALQPASIMLEVTASATNVFDDDRLKIIVLLYGYYN